MNEEQCIYSLLLLLPFVVLVSVLFGCVCIVENGVIAMFVSETIVYLFVCLFVCFTYVCVCVFVNFNMVRCAYVNE